MSLRKKSVYSTLSDYSRKILGKSCSPEQATLSGKSAISSNLSGKPATGSNLSGKSACSGDLSCKSATSSNLSDKSAVSGDLSVKCPLEETPSCKSKICPTPTLPNSPNYNYLNTDISIKTIEEPYSVQKVTSKNELIDKPKPERTSFQLCKIM